MSPEQDHSDSTRQAILAAALTLFTSQGYHGTSMRQIAVSAGIVPGGIYNHFPSKKELYLALLRQADFYPSLARVFSGASGDSTEDLLRDGARRAVATFTERDETMPLIMVEVLEFEAANLAALAQEEMPTIAGFFARVIALGLQRGDLKPVRPDVLARAFIGLFASYVITKRFLAKVMGQFPGLDLQADLVDDFVDILAYGILQQPTTQQSTEGGKNARRSSRATDKALRPSGGSQRPDATDQ